MGLDFKKSKMRTFLQKSLRLLYIRKKNRYDRVLPFCEYFNDRIQKAIDLGWGSGSSCYDNVYIFGDVKVGSNTFVGPFCILDGSGGLKIGNNCSIAAGVHIYTHNSVQWAISMGKFPYDYKKVEIGNGCYIGPNSVIVGGIKIGDRAIVGACSFVNKDVPSGAKVAGIPARIIGGGGGQINYLQPCLVQYKVAA